MDTFPDAEFTALHVLEAGSGDLSTFAGMTGDLPDEADELDRAEALLESTREFAAKRDVDVETDSARGRPDRLIVREAEEGEFDVIVVGSHGRDGIARVLLGSVAEKVVRRSPIPVLVVR